MAQHTFTIANEHGLHARPAGIIVQTCVKFDSKIYFIKNGEQYNCKSVLGIMKMGAAKGDEIIVNIDGADEMAALEAMKSLIDSNFNE